MLSDLAHGIVKREGGALVIRDLGQLAQMMSKFRE
jgi:hypothetical protein